MLSVRTDTYDSSVNFCVGVLDTFPQTENFCVGVLDTFPQTENFCVGVLVTVGPLYGSESTATPIRRVSTAESGEIESSIISID
jgi:hypothetical protein